jgi:hypothetical protein
VPVKYDVIVILDVIYLLPFEVQKDLFGYLYSILSNNGKLIIKTQNPAYKIKYFIDRLEEKIAVKLLGITATKQKEGKFYFIRPIDEVVRELHETGFDSSYVDLCKGSYNISKKKYHLKNKQFKISFHRLAGFNRLKSVIDFF